VVKKPVTNRPRIGPLIIVEKLVFMQLDILGMEIGRNKMLPWNCKAQAGAVPKRSGTLTFLYQNVEQIRPVLADDRVST
jgi:hypothetical protein